MKWNWMQGWNCGNGLIYLKANISTNKMSLSQSQGYTEGLNLGVIFL